MKERIAFAVLLAFVGLFIGVIAEKYGISRSKVPNTITWNKFFSERLDDVFYYIATCSLIGFLFPSIIFSNQKFLICPKCQNTYYKDDVKDKICTTCNVSLEKLEGFYERHPELKDESNTSS